MIIRTFALGCAVLLGAASAASAADMMANTYGNTVTTKSAKTGAVGQLYFNQDMTYQAKGADAKGQPIAYDGAWSLKDGGNTICLTPHIPNANPPPPTTCSPLSQHAVGESWTVTNDQGETFAITLTAGR